MIALYVLSFALLASVLGVSLKRSEFGVLVLLTEFPFLVGLCLYPLLLELDAVTPGIEGQSYLSVNGPPGWGTAAHILCYSFFATTGYLLAVSCSFVRPNAVARALSRLASPTALWRFLVLFGLAAFGLFLLLVGPDVALINAMLARGGEFEGFGDSAKFLFLKTLGTLSLYASCFIPFILLKQRGHLFFSLYVALILVAYLNSVSRNLILYQLLLPLLIVMRVQGFSRKNVILLAGVVVPATLFVLFFGKALGFFVSTWVSGGELIELTAYQGEEGLWNSVLRNFEFIWFSVDAGWLWFFRNGPIVPTDALMGFIGFIPSRVLESIGAGWLYHGNAEVRMACINAAQFGLDRCTLPPFITGVSAYVAPIAGAAVAGFLRFFVYGRLERMWGYYRSTDYSMTWVPYFLFTVFVEFTSFIPGSISLASFAIIAVLLALTARGVVRDLRPAAAHPSRDMRHNRA